MDDANTLERAMALVLAGDKVQAQQILAQMLCGNPRNEHVWFCLAAALDDPAKRRECLGHVLAIDPNHADALRMLAASFEVKPSPVTSMAEQPPVVQRGPARLPDDDDSHDFIRCKCPTCGSGLEITHDKDRFTCGHCGNEYLIRRSGGTISFEPVIVAIRNVKQGIDRVEQGVDRTASELAIARLREEIVALEYLKSQVKVSDGVSKSLGCSLLLFIGAFLLLPKQWFLWTLLIGGVLVLFWVSFNDVQRRQAEYDDAAYQKRDELRRHERIVSG